MTGLVWSERPIPLAKASRLSDADELSLRDVGGSCGSFSWEARKCAIEGMIRMCTSVHQIDSTDGAYHSALPYPTSNRAKPASLITKVQGLPLPKEARNPRRGSL